VFWQVESRAIEKKKEDIGDEEHLRQYQEMAMKTCGESDM